jgi:hypothetical protein
MPTSVQLHQKIADLAAKRADIEKKISDAHSRRSKKESEAAARDASAARASSEGMRRSYERQAQSARTEALRESTKIADLTKTLSNLARDTGTQQKALVTAQRSEAAATKRDEDRARRDREREDRRLAEQRKAEQRKADQARQAEDRRRRDEAAALARQRSADLAATASLLAATEYRVNARIDAIREPQKEQLRILYATAASQGDLRVDEEMRRVKAVVKAATHREQVNIEYLPAATPGDLLDYLVSFRPHVVHFSGHANESVLVFDDGSGTHGPGTVMSADIFKDVIESTDQAPDLVVLNACKSAAQLTGLLGKVPMAIGMSDSIGDADAITFATRFYSTLAEGQSINAALTTARTDMKMNGLPDYDLPIIETISGIDPTTVHLILAE